MDLYDDLDCANIPSNLSNQVSGHNEVECVGKDESLAVMRREVGQYKQQNAKLLRKCTMLEKNLSCLYKTAWAHVRRKDDYIQKLKTQIKVFRQVTGMVTPGVFLDGNHADVPDTAGVPVTSRREQHVQDDLQADVSQSSHQQNVKRSRRSCSSDRGFVFANAVHPESVNALHHADAPASRTGQWMGNMHGMAKAASAHTGHSRVPAYGNSQEANDGALCWGRCSPGRRNQATALHAEDAFGIPSVGAQLSSGAVGTAGTTPPASESFRTRQRYYNEHACAGRSGRASRRSRSRSPFSERQRQHPRLAAGHSETRPKNSQRTPHLLASGDLRWRHTSSHLVPRQSPPRHH